MRDDIGLGGVARAPEAAGKLVEEGRVDVDALVGRAIERPHRRLRRAAARLVGIAIGDQPCRRVGRAGLLENLAPHAARSIRARRSARASVRGSVWTCRSWSAIRPRRQARRIEDKRAIAEREDQDPDDPEPRRDERQQQAQNSAPHAADRRSRPGRSDPRNCRCPVRQAASSLSRCSSSAQCLSERNGCKSPALAATAPPTIERIAHVA